jgi:hypothetical protein
MEMNPDIKGSARVTSASSVLLTGYIIIFFFE